MKKVLYIGLTIFSFSFLSCSKTTSEEIIEVEVKPDTEVLVEQEQEHTYSIFYKILSLGDSYTIGQGVCDECNYPEQLRKRITNDISDIQNIDLKIVARTGWTTTDLLNSLSSQEIEKDYDFVTLLIGVNNQFIEEPFDVYKKEFPELVAKAIEFANGNKKKVVVLSIPDYAYTPFGQGDSKISEELTEYNNFAAIYCASQGVSFLNITDITEKGLENSALVSSDGLHPSTLAYEKFVDRLLPLFLKKVDNGK